MANKTIHLRVDMTPQQNRTVENSMNLKGYVSKAKFLRDSALVNSLSIDNRLQVMTNNISLILEEIRQLKKPSCHQKSSV